MFQAGIKVQTRVHCGFSSCLNAFIHNLNTSVLTTVFGLIHLVLLGLTAFKLLKTHCLHQSIFEPKKNDTVNNFKLKYNP